MRFTTEFYIFEAPLKPKSEGLYSKKKYEIQNRAYLRTRAGEAQNWKCCYCGEECKDDPNTNPKSKNIPTLEHIVPRSEGGRDTYDNAAMACAGCNNRRGNMCYDEFIEGIKTGSIKTHSVKKSKNKSRMEIIQKRRGTKYLKKAEALSANNWVSPSGRVMTFQSWFETLPKMDAETKQIIMETYGNV